MATQGNNQNATAKEEYLKNKFSTSEEKNKEQPASLQSGNAESGNSGNSPESNPWGLEGRDISQSYNRRLHPEGAREGLPQKSGNREPGSQPFANPANEWQQVGHSSNQHWWNSGTKQQQEFYSGEVNYPYRANDWQRNQQSQARIKNYYPQEPASERQRRNFAEGSQYPYEGGYGAENPQAREGLERAKELKGPPLYSRQGVERGAGENANSENEGSEFRQWQESPHFQERRMGKAFNRNSPSFNRKGGAGPLLQNHQESPGDMLERQARRLKAIEENPYQPSGVRQNKQERTPGWVRNQPMQKPSQVSPGRVGPGWLQYENNNENQVVNQNQYTMRANDRNFRNDNDYRDEEFGRGRGRSQGRGYDYERERTGRPSMNYERVSFEQERGFNRGNEHRERGMNQGSRQRMGSGYKQDFDRERFEQRREGRYHSTETDVPGRGYRSEREMNRHANNMERGGRGYGESSRANRGERNYGLASSHRASGPYDDFERDIDRYGIREDYQNRNGSYGRPDYEWNRDSERGRGREGNRSFYYRPGEEAERRRRLSARIQDQGLERSPGGNWGPSDYRRERGNFNER